MASGTGETGESPDPWTGLWAERWITQIDNNGEVINSRNIWINDFSFCGVKAPLLFCVQQICVDRIMKGKSQTRQKKSAVTVSVRLLSRGLYMDRNSGLQPQTQITDSYRSHVRQNFEVSHQHWVHFHPSCFSIHSAAREWWFSPTVWFVVSVRHWRTETSPSWAESVTQLAS